MRFNVESLHILDLNGLEVDMVSLIDYFKFIYQLVVWEGIGLSDYSLDDLTWDLNLIIKNLEEKQVCFIFTKIGI